MKLKKGDTVVVIAGKDKGVEGQIMRVIPKENKVIVTGVNISKRHAKARNQRDKAGIIDKDMPMDASNVMYVHNGKPTRIGYKVEADGTKRRVAKRTGEVIE
jgi:large subunit ribosomal protein L24